MYKFAYPQMHLLIIKASLKLSARGVGPLTALHQGIVPIVQALFVCQYNPFS